MKPVSERWESLVQKQRWISPACLAVSLVLTGTAVVFCCLRGLSDIEASYAFNLGAEIFSMAICSVLLYSIIQNRSDARETKRIFIILITLTVFVLFTDLCSWIVQGIPFLRFWNIAVNVLNYAGAAALIFYFWRYVRTSLELQGKFMDGCNVLMNVLLIPTVLACFANCFVPLYFSVDQNGVYARTAFYPASQIYLLIGLIIVCIGFFRSKVPMRERVITASFVLIPLLNQIITYYSYGLSTEYAAMMVSIVLIFGVLFAEREKRYTATEKELSMAASIQENMLPQKFPAFPERKDFDIFASMDPAREVGGDFYDFFLLDENHLALIIADVSGKGVPASLFMMAAMILIRSYLKSGMSPAKALETLNRQICSNNPKEMFITIWLGVLDLESGLLTAVNAGHEYPIVKEPEGTFSVYRDNHSFIVGGFEEIKYREYQYRMRPGTKMFLFTDGVTEATDTRNELFGSERLLKALHAVEGDAPVRILSGVKQAVDTFVGGAPQFDDQTMLCIEYCGRGHDEMKEITVEAVRENLEPVTDFVNEQLQKVGCPIKKQMQIDIVIDEIFSNIAKFAYEQEPGEVTVRVNAKADEAILTFFDAGMPYNPLEQDEPDMDADLEDRKIGGLGLVIVKKMMDDVRYEYENGQNVLELRKKL